MFFYPPNAETTETILIAMIAMIPDNIETQKPINTFFQNFFSPKR